MKTQNEQTTEKTVINADNINNYVIDYVATCDASVKRNTYTDKKRFTAKYTLNVNFDTIPLIDIIDRACSPIVINDQGNARNKYSTKENRDKPDETADQTLFDAVNGTEKTVNVSELGKRTVLTDKQKLDKTLSAMSPEQRADYLRAKLAEYGIQ